MTVSTAIRIKKIRSDLGISQEEFAKCLGVTQSAICLYEGGKRLPTMRVAYKISDLARLEGVGEYDISEIIPREEVLLSEREVYAA